MQEDPTLKVFSMITNQGTAMPETGFCELHKEWESVALENGIAADDIGDDHSFHEVSANELIYCNECGLNGYRESDTFEE